MNQRERYEMKKILFVDEYDNDKMIIEYEDYISAIGGDGTLLKAIQKYKHLNKPFFGVAKGTVNFLMNSSKYISKNCKIKSFKLINVIIKYQKYERDMSSIDNKLVNKEITLQAFNDVMIGGNMNSWITFDIKEKDDIFGTFQGGGLIISTPQGSTGINKNNNGSVLPLSSNLWSITGDKTSRKIDYVIKPTKINISCLSRTPVSVWVDGNNHVISNISSITISPGSNVDVIFNDFKTFKKKRRI